ncbi:MAG: Panacea domain-containing protein [Planctomycetaceae bacterium]
MAADDRNLRLIEVASAVLHAAPGHSLNAVVLNKVLFYIDLATLRDRGETLTQNPYVALQNGPVIAKYQNRLIDRLNELGIARQISQWDGSKPIVLEVFPTQFQFLNSEDMIKVSDVTSFFADSTSRIASEFSHRNPGWQLARNQYQRDRKPVAVNMRIALQQIIEADPWMLRPISDGNQMLSNADAAIGEDW